MDFLDQLLALPTAIFTVLMGIVLLYWVFFFVGALDLDILGGADGALEGAADGALEGAAEGALEGAADGAVEGGLGGLLSVLRLRSVPVTIVVSFLVFFGWLASYALRGWLDDVLPSGWLEVIVFLGASTTGVFGASLAVRPFRGLFTDHPARQNHELIGSIVVITTGRVDESFGQAQCTTRDSLLLDVRAKAAIGLKRNDRAIVVDYDPDTRTFTVDAADPLLIGLDGLEGKR